MKNDGLNSIRVAMIPGFSAKTVFLQQAMAQSGAPVPVKIPLDELLTSVGRVFEIDDAGLCGPGRKRSFAVARGVAAWLVSEMGQHTLAELARRMHRDPSALSFLAKKTRERAASDPCFGLKINQIKSAIQSNNSLTHA
ncbi:MAG: hypothetical protein Q9M24_07275 [Mariprofundaceae bacterium]|nr:hypothetical protein [Mariprofundaceae bacterium]